MHLFRIYGFIQDFHGKYSAFLFLYGHALLWRMLFLLITNIRDMHLYQNYTTPGCRYLWKPLTTIEWKITELKSFILLGIFLYSHIFQSSKSRMTNSVGYITRRGLGFRLSYLSSFSQPQFWNITGKRLCWNPFLIKLKARKSDIQEKYVGH